MLYKNRRWLEAGNFGLRKKRNCTIYVAKTREIISLSVTAKMIVFDFIYAKCLFSLDAAQLSISLLSINIEDHACSSQLCFLWGIQNKSKIIDAKLIYSNLNISIEF